MRRMRIACAHERDRALHTRRPRPRTSSATSPSNDIEFLFAQFVDMHGKPNAKLVPARLLRRPDGGRRGLRRLRGRRRSASSRTTPISPRCRTCAASRRCRGSPSVARLACDVHVEGEEWPYCPRTILRRQLDRARELGYEFMIGAELEYFLVRETEDGGDRAGRPARHARPALLRHARRSPATSTSSPRLRATSPTLGWNNYATDHEDANGQFEQNFDFADALTTCDRAIFFRYMVESLAQERGDDRHVHAEAVRPPDRQRLPLPHEPVEGRRERVRGDPADDPRGLGLSETAYQFIGGLKAHAKAYIASPRRRSARTSGW